MGSLTALALVTPVFGFSLTPPPAIAAASTEAMIALDQPLSLGDATPQISDAEYTAQIQERADVISLHKPFGITTWGSMTGTVLLGLLQYYNQYGVFAGQGNNPCVKGDAIFGQGQCDGLPTLHFVSMSITTGLYLTTFTLSVLMPDPDNADEGDSEYAQTVSLHKTLRWVHSAGMLVQLLLGVFVANADWFGLDRANDYGTLQGLATVHLATGLVTYGALTWAMSLML